MFLARVAKALNLLFFSGHQPFSETYESFKLFLYPNSIDILMIFYDYYIILSSFYPYFYHILPYSTISYHILPYPTISYHTYHILPYSTISTNIYHILPYFHHISIPLSLVSINIHSWDRIYCRPMSIYRLRNFLSNVNL